MFLKLAAMLLCLQVAAMQQNLRRFTPFVTFKQKDLENKTAHILNFDESNEKVDFQNYYKLRFRPVRPMPRVFWPKIKLKWKFNQTLDTTTVATEVTTEMTTTESEIDLPETTTTSKPVMMMTSATPPILTPRPTSVVFTTPTTIMRPAYRPKPIWFDSLKKLLLFGSPLQVNLLEKQKFSLSKPAAKGKGFLGLFEVINFNNTACSVNMDDVRTMEGTCYHEFECKNLGGIPTKPCAEGAGICCIFVTSCGDSTDQSVAYFESPNYPNPVREMMICVLIVNLRPNVEQLRLDFLMFELNRPANGDCVDDQFIVSGQNMNYAVPILCGINTGQHKDDLAPPNCLQYFTETEGIVKSFNYDIDGTIVENKEATYLNNLNYAICIQRAKETCSVAYFTEQGNGEVPDFQIINKDEDENDLVPDGQAGAGIFNCPDDFIAINSVRLCGERFNDGIDNDDFTMNAVVRDIAAGPIIMPVRTDIEYVGRGFRLLYKQELCV